MSTVISIQPGQPGEGMNYNVHKPLPYPFHIDPRLGDCIRGRGTVDFREAPAGSPWRLFGFQRDVAIQHVDLLFAEFVADPQRAVGMFPVFGSSADPHFFNLYVPITDVMVDSPRAVEAATR